MRFAIYFAPAEDHPLTGAAATWLGRNAFTGESLQQPEVPGLTAERVHELTADPRRYGFHATLKAPFELAGGYSADDLTAAMAGFAGTARAFTIPEMRIAQLGEFFALVPDKIYPELQDFAAAVVRSFESYRAPLKEADIVRRKPETLSENQRRNLDLWGYPYVMDDFQFHMTLTGRVPAAEAPAIHAALRRHFTRFDGQPLTVDAITLFTETERGASFTAERRAPLSAIRTEGSPEE